MITIKQETFDAMYNALYICDPMSGFKLKDVNRECEFCRVYEICQIISNDEGTRK
jgi:hypothetical protein